MIDNWLRVGCWKRDDPIPEFLTAVYWLALASGAYRRHLTNEIRKVVVSAYSIRDLKIGRQAQLMKDVGIGSSGIRSFAMARSCRRSSFPRQHLTVSALPDCLSRPSAAVHRELLRVPATRRHRCPAGNAGTSLLTGRTKVG